MSKWINFPNVYEINTWVWLNDLSQKYQRPITLGIVPEKELEILAGYNFDAVWLMGVWKRSPRAREITIGNTQDVRHLQKEFKYALPDYSPKDVVGSPFAIFDYHVDKHLGGDIELAEIRERLNSLGLKLILDFVPNHLAVDHPWLIGHPEYFVQGSHKIPFKYFTDGTGGIFAHGSAHGLYGWTDTVQLDYRHADTRERMTDILLDLTKRCDGVRCDMAMLVTNQEFCKWGGKFDKPNVEFWTEAIPKAKRQNSDFLLIGEVYGDFAYTLQQQGFDYTYDSVLYDRLVIGNIDSLLKHLNGGNINFHSHLVRFIENHDRQRAKLLWGRKRSCAIATLTLTLPGLHIIHQGQMEGNELKIPVQLGRRTEENSILELESFYKKLLAALRHPIFHNGDWQMLQPRQENPENNTYKNIVASQWTKDEGMRLMVVNLTSDISTCFIPLKMPNLAQHSWQLIDLLDNKMVLTDRGNLYNGDEILDQGLYLDLAPYEYHLFTFQVAANNLQ